MGSDWPKASCPESGRADSELSLQVPNPSSDYPPTGPDPHQASHTLTGIDGDSLHPPIYDLLLSLLAGLVLVSHGQTADVETLWAGDPGPGGGAVEEYLTQS